jgi:hypothetical protein
VCLPPAHFTESWLNVISDLLWLQHSAITVCIVRLRHTWMELFEP